MNLFQRICTRALLLVALIGLILFAALPTQAQFFGGLAGSQPVFPFASTNWNTTNSTISGAWSYAYPLPPATSTNAVFPRIECPNQRFLPMTLSANGNTNTPTVTLSIIRSPDGVLWETTPYALLSIAPASGANATYCTNIDMGGFKYATALGFTNSAGISNAVVWFGVKPGF